MTYALRMIGAGLASAAAPTLEGTLEALQARQTFFEKADNYVGGDFAPQLCAFRTPTVGDDLCERLLALLTEAVADLVRRHGMVVPRYHVALCLPEVHMQEGTQCLGDVTLLQRMRFRTVELFTNHGWPAPQSVLHYTSGSVGALQAMQQPSDEERVILAVDSYACRDRLNKLNAQWLLFSKENPWGFIPGEGAAAVLFSGSGDKADKFLIGPSIRAEPDTELDGRDSLASGLTEAMQDAAGSVQAPISQIVTDCNNSRYRASEAAYATQRLPKGSITETSSVIHTPMRLGETGAASLLMALLTAVPVGNHVSLFTVGARRSGLRGAVVSCSLVENLV